MDDSEKVADWTLESYKKSKKTIDGINNKWRMQYNG